MNHIGVLSTVSYHPEEGHEISLAHQTSAKHELTTIRRIYGVLNDISNSISFDIERRVDPTDTHHPYAAIGGSRNRMANAIYEYQHQSSFSIIHSDHPPEPPIYLHIDLPGKRVGVSGHVYESLGMHKPPEEWYRSGKSGGRPAAREALSEAVGRMALAGFTFYFHQDTNSLRRPWLRIEDPRDIRRVPLAELASSIGPP